MNRKAILYLSALFLAAASQAIAAGAKGPWADKFIKIGDIKVHYLEAGGGDRTLVFVPVWIVPADIWREQIPYFSVRGFRVIAVDPRSQGQTEKTDVGNTYRQQAADLYEFLQKLDIEHSYLVGWSSGTITLLRHIYRKLSMIPDGRFHDQRHFIPTILRSSKIGDALDLVLRSGSNLRKAQLSVKSLWLMGAFRRIEIRVTTARFSLPGTA